MGITIIGPDGEKDTTTQVGNVRTVYDMPEDLEEGVIPGLEIRSPEAEPQQDKPPLLIPSTVFPVKPKVYEILGDN